MKRTLYSLVVLLGLLITPIAGVAAQPTASDQTYISEITGEEIDIGSSGQISWIAENFDYRETPSFQEEYIWFTYGWSNFQLVLIGGPNEAADYHEITLGNMEAFYDEWELIDEDITDEHSWFLGEGELNGASIIVYYEFELDAFGDIDLVVMQFTDASTFQRDLEFVQAEVTVGGEPLLPDTDAAALASLIGVEPDSTDTTDETGTDDESTSRTSRTSRGTDATTDDGDDEETGRTSRTSRGGTDATTGDDDDEETSRTSRTSRGTDTTTDDEEGTTPSRTTRGGTDTTTDDDDEGNTSETTGSQTDRESRTGRLDTDIRTGGSETDETDTDSTPVSGGDWSELGLISDSEWESPSYGTVITWDTVTWEFPNDFEFAIVVEGEPPYDIITLQTIDGLGYVYITIDNAYEATPRGLVDYWLSDEYAAQIAGGVSVLDTATTSTSAAIVYESVDAADLPIIVVLEATFTEDGGIVFSQITAAPETIHEVYAQYLEGVEVDGAPLEMTFTVEDIREIAGN